MIASFYKCSRNFGLILLLPALLLGCATGSREQLLMPAPRYSELGLAAWDSLRRTATEETAAHPNRYLRCVTDILLDGLDGNLKRYNWEVRVLRDQRPSLTVLPGGKIAVNTGLLDVVENQHQLAALLAHELGHVNFEHGNERIVTHIPRRQQAALPDILRQSASNQSQQVMALLGVGPSINVVLPFSRRQESEADLYALNLMAKMGFDPREASAAWTHIQAAGNNTSNPYGATHPVGESRLYHLRRILEVPLAQYGRARASGVNPKCR